MRTSDDAKEQRRKKEFAELESQLNSLHAKITELQAKMAPLCPHPGVWVHRGYRVGQCPKCSKQFLTSNEVDKLYDELKSLDTEFAQIKRA